MKHAELVERAVRWLAGSRRCEPVYAGNASCREIPDAIGWSSCHKWHGSHVVECKCSLSDFRADKYKYLAYKHPKWEFHYPAKRGVKQMIAEGYTEVVLPRMGDFRWYLCAPRIITPEQVAEHHAGHGLLYVEGRRIRIITEARRRETPDYPSEIRYLRFAIINRKPAKIPSVTEPEANGVFQFSNPLPITAEDESQTV